MRHHLDRPQWIGVNARWLWSLFQWVGLVALVCVIPLGCSSPGEYPNRPITIICPWSVGGGTDRVSRQMAVFLEKELGVPVNVVNTTGGQGVTGHSTGLRAKPDGYTLTMMTLELNVLHWRKLTRLTWQDCQPLMSLNEDAAALFVRADAPWESLSDLQKDVKANPGKLHASGTAALGAWHLALAGWLISMDMQPSDIVWVPHNGAGPSLQEMMSGELDMVCCSLPEARNLFVQGELRCLGVMSENRVPSPTFAEIPTFKEQGFDWELVGWRGLGVPVDTPEDVRQVLVGALRRIVSGETRVATSDNRTDTSDTPPEGESFPEFMEKQEFDHTWRATDDFAAFLEENDEKFGTILQRPEFQTVNSGPIGPMVFPYALFALLGFILAVLGVQRLRNPDRKAPGFIADLKHGRRFEFLLVLASVVIYLFAAQYVGFLLTAGSVLFVLLWRLGTRWTTSVLLTLLLTPMMYQLFAGILRVPLPRGILGW